MVIIPYHKHNNITKLIREGLNMKPRVEKAVYNVPEIAALLDIHLPKAYELARSEKFPSIRIGKRIVIPKVAFERWLEEASGQ